MTLAGELYAQGLGVKPSNVEAARWYKLGAAAGDPRAMFELAMMTLKGDGVPKDRAAAKSLFNRDMSTLQPLHPIGAHGPRTGVSNAKFLSW